MPNTSQIKLISDRLLTYRMIFLYNSSLTGYNSTRWQHITEEHKNIKLKILETAETNMINSSAIGFTGLCHWQVGLMNMRPICH